MNYCLWVCAWKREKRVSQSQLSLVITTLLLREKKSSTKRGILSSVAGEQIDDSDEEIIVVKQNNGGYIIYTTWDGGNVRELWGVCCLVLQKNLKKQMN